jgi:hypothetical protein
MQRNQAARGGGRGVRGNRSKEAASRFWNLPAGRNWSLAEPKNGVRRKSSQKLQFGDQQLALCDKLNPIQESKWKSWFTWQSTTWLLQFGQAADTILRNDRCWTALGGLAQAIGAVMSERQGQR